MPHANPRKSCPSHKMTPIFTHPMGHLAPLGRVGMTQKCRRLFFGVHGHAIASPRSIMEFHDMRVYGRKLTWQPTVHPSWNDKIPLVVVYYYTTIWK